MEQYSQPKNEAPESAPEQENLLDDVYDNSMEGYDKPVKRVRIMLFIIAGLQLIGIASSTNLPEPENWITMGIYVFLGIVFSMLALWTKRKPYTAIITAMVVYIGLNVLSAVLDSATIIQGILVKIVIVSLLIAGLKNAKDVQEWLDSKDKVKRVS